MARPAVPWDHTPLWPRTAAKRRARALAPFVLQHLAMSDPSSITMAPRPVIRRSEPQVTPARAPAPAPQQAPAMQPPQPRDTFQGANAPADLSATMRQAFEQLHTGATDWRVSGAEVARVTELLGRLSPPDYRSAMQQLQRSGQLDGYVGGMSDSARQQFISQATRQGYLRCEGGRAAPAGAGGPPPVPALVVNDRTLPSSVRSAITANNTATAEWYQSAHREYLQRYVGEVNRTESVPELRRLGPPAADAEIIEPGSGRLLAPSHGHVRANAAIADHVDDLLERERAGSFSLRAYGGGSLHVPGTPLVVGAQGSSRVSEGGHIESEGEAGIGAGAHSSAGQAEAELSGHGVTLRGTRAGTGGALTIDEHGRTEVAVLNGGVGGTVTTNPHEARVEVGVIGQVDLPGHAGQLRGGVAVGFRGMTRDEIHDALATPEGFFARPPELDHRQGWNQLDPERQRALSQRGWTPEEWAASLPRQ